MVRAKKFGRLLTEGIHRIRLRENKSVQIVQDELGFMLNRDGGSSIRYWRAGHVPAQMDDVTMLAREIVRRGQLEVDWLRAFLESADYVETAVLCTELFPAYQPDSSSETAVTEMVPFVVGPPVTHPRQFFGREAALGRVFDVIRGFPLQNVAIIGPYRSGKTSMLHYLKNITTAVSDTLRPSQKQNWLPHPQSYRWVLVDFQDPRMGRQERLLRYLLTSLELPIPTPCDIVNFMDVVSDHLKQPTIILMDEIGAALASPELDLPFWWSLRALCSTQTNGNLAFILTAHDTPSQLAQEQGKPSPFFNIFGHTLTLEPLTEAEARELLSCSPITFSAEDTAWILQESGRWPMLLQLMAHIRLTAVREGRDDDAWQAECLRKREPFGLPVE